MVQNILTVLVASVSEKKTVLQFNSNMNVEASVSRLLLAATTATSMNTRASFHAESGVSGTLHYKMNRTHLFVCVTDRNYPQRLALQLCDDLEERFGRKKTKNKHLKNLAVKYETPESLDNVSSLDGEVDRTKEIIHKNMPNSKNLPNVRKTEKEMPRRFICDRYMWVIVITMLFFVAGGVFWFVFLNNKKNPYGENMRDFARASYTLEPSEKIRLRDILFP